MDMRTAADDSSDDVDNRFRQALYATAPLQDQYRDIRILTLEPGSKEDNIKCNLQATRLSSSAPPFETLSHCWGEGLNTERIRVNDCPLLITEALWQALQHLRHVSSPRRLWIDAICIDQSSAEEKPAQISLMREIFAAATLTVAWIGPGDEASKDTLKMASYLASHTMPEKYEGLSDSDRPPTLNYKIESRRSEWINWFVGGRTDPLAIVGELKHAALKKHFPKARFYRLLTNQWFSRMWILQEAALSKKVLLKCGDNAVWLKSFLAAALAELHIYLQGNVSPLDHENDLYAERWKSFTQLMEAKNTEHPGLETLSLSSLLTIFRRSDAKYPVDKFYALYGLAIKDVQALNLQPDYQLPAQKIYTDITYAMLNKLNDVLVLEIPRGNGRLRQTLPSWVPDWTDITRFGEGLTADSQRRRKLTEPATYLGRQRYELFKAERNNHFCASDFTSTFRCIRDENDVLSVRGLIFDRVIDVGFPMKEAWDSLSHLGHPSSLTWARYLQEAPIKWAPKHLSGAVAALDDLTDRYLRLASSDGNDSKYPSVGEDETRQAAYAQTLCAGSLPAFRSLIYESQLPWNPKLSGGQPPPSPQHDNTFSKEDWLASFSSLCRAWASTRKWRHFGERMPFEITDPFRPLIDLFRPTANRLDASEREPNKKFVNGLAAQVSSMIVTRGIIPGSEPSLWIVLLELIMLTAPTYRRRMAETDMGFFALVPEGTEAGDKIVILEGGNLPLVMRDTKGEGVFELVGESYVHGIMFGEAWDESQCETIRIR
ncbi:MAG: hypothetical protein Q9160_006208 [Pyrenula sp. 1 TL-2023]